MARPSKKATAASRDLLGEAVNASNTGTPFMATEAEMSGLLKDTRGALVEYNATIKDGDKIAFRATALGVQVHSAAKPQSTPAPAPAPATWGAPAAPMATPPAPAPAAPAAAPTNSGRRGTYKFGTGIPIPIAARGGRGSTVYGFETMDVNQSFFIPATDDNPNPAKRIASTVSSATKRLDPKRFIVRSVTANADMAREWDVSEGVKGAGIWRTE